MARAMGAYGQSNLATAADVRFPFDLALEAARDVWQLAQKVRDTAGDIRGAARNEVGPWKGPKREDFDERWPLEDRNADTVADGFEALARQFAEAWSRARGEQDRINHARYVAAEEEKRRKADEGFQLRDISDAVIGRWAGQPDYGPTPSDPPVPSSPHFATNHRPVHPEYGP